MAEGKNTPGEVWEAKGLYVYRGRDCIGIFDTDNATIQIMEQRARVAAAAPDLLIDLEWILGVAEKAYTDPKARADVARSLSRIAARARAAISRATVTP